MNKTTTATRKAVFTALALALAAAFTAPQLGCEAKKAAAPTATPPAAQTSQAHEPPAAATSAAPAESKGVAGIPAPAGEQPAFGDWVVSRLPVEMKSILPLNPADAYAARAVGYIFDTLLFRNAATLQLEPNLAESWEAAPDHLSYTFKLRDGVKFHDGHPLTVEDVKFTFDKLMDPASDCVELRSYYQDITSCDIVDDHTVKYTCKKPFFLHEVMLGDLEVIPKHIYESGDFKNHPNARQPIGSGPYKFDKWETNQQITLVRNPDYWGKALGREGHIDKFVWRIITDDNAAMQLALRGDLDSLTMLPREWNNEGASPAFEKQFNKFTYNAPNYWYIGWNQTKPFFADKLVRRAMTLLCDRETIRQKILFGLFETISGDFLPGTPEFNPAIKPWPFDPAAATKLLDESGWVDHDGDGIRDKDGVPFKFEMLIATSAPEWEQIATILQEELKRNGIVLTIRQLEWANMIDAVHKHQFDSMILGWAMDPDPDMYQLWHSSQIKEGSNYCGFNVPEADKLIDEYRASFDHARRIEICHRFHEIEHEEQAYTFLFAPKVLSGVSKRIHNAIVYPVFRSRPNLAWYVPAELQKYKGQ